MRTLQIALVAATLTIPSAGYSEDQGLVGGRVGAGLESSPAERPSSSWSNPYAVPLERRRNTLASRASQRPARSRRTIQPSWRARVEWGPRPSTATASSIQARNAFSGFNRLQAEPHRMTGPALFSTEFAPIPCRTAAS
jgi:hypothetical protein